ncbi:MAG: TetR/AcrR family transcriptional regulator [Actinomycetales bacterium]
MASGSSTASATTSESEGSRARLPRSERREQLLAAAQEVFVSAGYHAAGMDDIAERAGVSKPVLYQHFPSKLDLYLALFDLRGQEMVAAVRSALERTSDNKQRVAAAIEAYFAFVDAEGEAFRLLFESDLLNDAAVRSRIDGVTRACAEPISEVIINDAGLPREHAMLLAVGMVGMAQVAARFWLDSEAGAGEAPVPRPTAVELMAALSWRGIRGFPRTHLAVPSGSPGAGEQTGR